MTDTTDVKANVKLKFKNRQGYVCVAVRSLQLTRKRTKLEFKALDSVLKTVNDEQKTVSTSMKCSELDRQIPDLIGVSGAVLENVIFCHQEESDWPMQDGATVKKKFDDIFDSTRYSKALEAISKAKKDKLLIAKDLKGQVLESSAHLTAAKGFRSERDKCEASLRDDNERLQHYQNELAGINQKVCVSERNCGLCMMS